MRSFYLLIFLACGINVLHGQNSCSQWKEVILEVDSSSMPPDEHYALYHLLLEDIDSVSCPGMYSGVLRRLGNRYRKDGRLDEALVFLERSLPIDSALVWHDALGSTSNSMGRIYAEQKKYVPAQKYFLKAQGHYAIRDFRSIGALDSRYNLAQSLLLSGDTIEALAVADEGISVWQKAFLDTANALDSAYLYQFEKLKILGAFERTMSGGEVLSSLVRLRENCLSLAHQPDLVCDIDLLMAQLQERQGHIEEAIEQFSEALNGDQCDWDRNRQSEITNKLISLAAIQEKRIMDEKRRSELKSISIAVIVVLLLLGVIISALLMKSRGQAIKIAEQQVEDILKAQELQSVESMFLGQERERKRIAEELHDRLGGMLSSLKLHYSSVERQISALSEQVTTQYHKAIDIIDETAEEVRRISHDLYSGTLVDYGLVVAIEQLADTLNDLDGPTFEWDINRMEERLDSELEINLYRIVQEGISNILKHAHASNVMIQINRFDSSVDLLIEDDGQGFDSSKTTDGIGMKNIASRVTRLGGELNVDSVLGRGTILIIQIPLET